MPETSEWAFFALQSCLPTALLWCDTVPEGLARPTDLPTFPKEDCTFAPIITEAKQAVNKQPSTIVVLTKRPSSWFKSQ